MLEYSYLLSQSVYMCVHIYTTVFTIHYFVLYEEYMLCSRTHFSEPKHEPKIEVYFLSMKTMISEVRSHLATGLFNCKIDEFVD